MSEPVYGEAEYLVLHFLGGKLVSTKVAHSWRGAVMSKQNHERMYARYAGYHRLKECYAPLTRIIPIDAVLAIMGLEKPDTELSAEDMELLRKMGIA